MGRKSTTRCTATKKRRFRDHGEAIAALHHFGASSTRERIPTDAYFCNICSGWHLTSTPWGGETKRATTRR